MPTLSPQALLSPLFQRAGFGASLRGELDQDHARRVGRYTYTSSPISEEKFDPSFLVPHRSESLERALERSIVNVGGRK
jgi:hypothetical protein